MLEYLSLAFGILALSLPAGAMDLAAFAVWARSRRRHGDASNALVTPEPALADR